MPFDFDQHGSLLTRAHVALRIGEAAPRVSPQWQDLYRNASSLIESAYNAAPDAGGPGSALTEIEHVVVLMNENRSFDHYFGNLSGVRGFGTGSAQGVFRQTGYPQPGAEGHLTPWRLAVRRTVHDPDHSWAGQHDSWNGGAMDGWARSHVASDGEDFAAITMGYYTRQDIPIHYALADAFTVCDGFHCSVLGPTDPNRLFAMTGTIDPDGWQGGPMLSTQFPVRRGRLGWKTYPECLQDHGVQWKIYQDRTLGPLSESILSGMMDWFAAYLPAHDADRELGRRAFDPTFPHDFEHDVATGALPAVSWVVPSPLECEHPTFPASLGAVGIMRVLKALIANPEVWARTVLFVTYDENGGFFDHVTPETAAEGTPGEWVSAELAEVHGGTDKEQHPVAGPVGVGFRVPCLVISPYSRGGLVATDRFDHSSILRFIERIFGVPIPDHDPANRRAGLSAWRRAAVGDLTTAFDFTDLPPADPPPLPQVADPGVLGYLRQIGAYVEEWLHELPPYPATPEAPLDQEATPVRPRVPSQPA